MAPVLGIHHASKGYATPEGGQVTALDDLSLTVERNEFLTLLGPSGCGKTTLLRAISGFEELDAGEILIDGQRIDHQPAHKRPVNTVFQNYALFPHLSVARNVAYSLEVARVPRPEVSARVGAMLDLVGLGGFGDRRIRQLSGGQQQRVALARSLVARPKILLLDEPLSALDRNLRQKMQQELKTIQNEVGISFIFVTHDQEEALTMSDRIAVLGEGRIHQLGTPEALYRRPENEFVARFIGEGNLFEGHVAGVEGGEARIALTAGQSVLFRRPDLGIGQSVKLLVRPEDVTVGAGQDAHDLTFAGTIAQVFFVGSDYRLIVQVEGLPPLQATIRPGRGAGRLQPEPGAAIALNVSRDALHLVADRELS